MRFACPYCQTKYQIPADKMAGGLVRVKCKVCEKVIAVRSPQSTEQENPRPTGISPPEHQANEHWHYVAGEERMGPRSLQNLIDAIQAGSVTPESFAWRPGMESWEKVGDIEELSTFLPGVPTEVPPPPLDRKDTAALSQKAQGRGTGNPVGRPKPRTGRFGRASSRKRPGAPVGAPKTRAAAPSRRFPGSSGSRSKETEEKREELQHLPQPRKTEESTTQQSAAVEQIEQTVNTPVSIEETTARVSEVTEFDATLPDSSAIEAIAGDLENVPGQQGDAPDEGEQLSLLSDPIELPQATKEKREFGQEEEEQPLIDEREETASAATEESSETDESLELAPNTDEDPEEEIPEGTEPSGEAAEETREEGENVEVLSEETSEEPQPSEEVLEEEIPEEAEPSGETTGKTPEEGESEEVLAEEISEEPQPSEEVPEEHADTDAVEEYVAEETAAKAEKETTWEDEESAKEAEENIEPDQEEHSGTPVSDDATEEAEENKAEAEEELVLEDELILEADESEMGTELALDDPSNPETAGQTLPFHLDEDRRTSLDQLFSPLDSEPTSSESIIVPFAAPEEEEAREFQNLLIPGEDATPDFTDDESTADDLAEESTQLDTHIPEGEASPLPPGIPQVPEEAFILGDEEGKGEALESNFFTMDSEEADESSVNFEFAPPALPTKEEIEEGKKELKRLISESTEEDKSKTRERENAEAKKAQDDLKKLGMEAPVSRPSGRRLTGIAAAIVALVMVAMFVIPESEEASPPPEAPAAPQETADKGTIHRPTYAPPPVPEIEEAENIEEQVEKDSDTAAGEESTNELSWKSNFEENTETAEKKKATAQKEQSEQRVPKKESSAPLDNRALAGLMGKDDGADLRGLKETTKKALSDMRTATEVSSDVLNKLFVKKSPAIKRCATRHNLTGKVVVKFTVKTSGATANTRVDATPTPPSADGIDCIEKIVSGWKFPAQDDESVFSKILVF